MLLLQNTVVESSRVTCALRRVGTSTKHLVILLRSWDNNTDLKLETFIILSCALVLANAISDIAPLRAPFPHTAVLFYNSAVSTRLTGVATRLPPMRLGASSASFRLRCLRQRGRLMAPPRVLQGRWLRTRGGRQRPVKIQQQELPGEGRHRGWRPRRASSQARA